LSPIENTIYSIGRNPGGGAYHIYAHDICSGALINSIMLPDSGTPGWGLAKGEDGELYFTMSFANVSHAHTVYHVEKDLSAYNLVWSLPQISGYNTHGVAQDEFGNFFIVLTRNSPGATTIYKVGPGGNTIHTISDNSLNGTGFGGTWGIVYNKYNGKLYMGTLGDDCVAVVDAGGQFGNMTYEAASGVGHVPGTYSKAINIVRECCPTNVSFTLDTVVCGVPFGEEVHLSRLISCDDGVFCEGNWSSDPGNSGINYDPCDQTISFTTVGACGEFTLTAAGGGGQCGVFDVTLNVGYGEIIAPEVAGDQTICPGDDPDPFTVVTPGSGTSTIEYQWQSSTIDCSSGFQSIPGANSPTYDPPADPATTIYYRLLATVDASGCSSGLCRDTSNCLTVAVREIQDAGLANLVCNDNGTPTDPSDDFVSFELNPTGTALPPTYSLVADNGGVPTLMNGDPATNLPFGSASQIRLQDGSADGTVYNITINHDVSPNCSFQFPVSVSSCSNDNVDLALIKTEISTGPYLVGDNVNFEITVYNQGTLPVTDIEVTDYLPTGFVFNPGDNPDFSISGSDAVAMLPSLGAGGSQTLEITLQIDPSFTGTTLINNAEITAYTGFADEDSTPGNNSTSSPELASDNDIDDESAGSPGLVDNPTDEDDFDPAAITVLQTFDLALRKLTLTAGPVLPGDDVLFQITVFNQGDIPGSDIVVNDYIPTGFIFNPGDNSDFGLNGGNAEAMISNLPAGDSVNLFITLQVDPLFTGIQLINNAEIISANEGPDEDSTPGNNGGSAPELASDNDIADDSNGGTDNPADEDDFDPATIAILQSFDLALRKLTMTAGPVLPGTDVDFQITIFNQGDINADNIVVTDYIPAGYLFDPADNSDFMLNGVNAEANIATLLPGDSINLFINLQIDPLFDGATIVNNAEISSADGGTDEDSSPGNNSTSSPELATDNDIADDSNGGVDNPADEDDFDPAEIAVFIPSDYGDLPDTYLTTNTENGPSHMLSQNLYLGTYVDAEADGQPENMAGRMIDGDDNLTGIFSYGISPDGDDEDGVTLLTPLIPGNTACLEVTTHYDDGGSGDKAYLTAWMDWNGSGTFEAGEQVLFNQMMPPATDAEVPAGDLTLPYCFDVPADATFLDGAIYFRVRLSTTQGLDYFESAPDGEVEDYKIPLAKVGNYVWQDANLNGVQDDGGLGINGVMVELTWAGPDGDINTIPDNLVFQVFTQTMVGMSGGYMFSGLVPGTYSLTIPTSPVDFTPTTVNDPAATDFTDSDNHSGTVFTISDVENLPTSEDGTTDNPGASGFPDNQEDISFDFGYFGACSLQVQSLSASDCLQNRFNLDVTIAYENLPGDIEVLVNGRAYTFSKAGISGTETFRIPKLTCAPSFVLDVVARSAADPSCNSGLFASITAPCPDASCRGVQTVKN
jgi:uncharacterized repeat protein (TIGR01451 family)